MNFPIFGGQDTGKKPKAKTIRKNVRAGLGFPVGRIHRHLKDYNRVSNRRVQTKASIYLTAALEYLCAELMEISGGVAKGLHQKRISRRHLMLAIRNDNELNKLMKNVIIPQGNSKPKRKGKSTKNKPRPGKIVIEETQAIE